MSDLAIPKMPTAAELERMHALYREGGATRAMAPHAIYADDTCPHAGCDQRMQAIDFRVESYGPAVHDPLVRAWWADVGFAARCPKCLGWVHFTIRGKRAISAAEAATLPNLPDDWAGAAIIL
jgi:hypothetical protein